VLVSADVESPGAFCPDADEVDDADPDCAARGAQLKAKSTKLAINNERNFFCDWIMGESFERDLDNNFKTLNFKPIG
jgi:hypothetical protein